MKHADKAKYGDRLRKYYKMEKIKRLADSVRHLFKYSFYESWYVCYSCNGVIKDEDLVDNPLALNNHPCLEEVK